MSRPEHIAPADVFYNETEAEKYASNSRMIKIQSQMAERCLELLVMDDTTPKFLLDLGCGSGLSGAVLEEAGHTWVGLDLSKHMLESARRRDAQGDMFVSDLGQGFGFRPGSFDGAISVSALQWLCYSDKKEHTAHKRLMNFFHSLYRALHRGARAALQIYPESPEQIELITSTALRCGFSGGLVVDYPNSTKAKKYFLCLSAGPTTEGSMPTALGTDASTSQPSVGVRNVERRKVDKRRGKQKRTGVKTKDWILMKKERQRRQGKEVRPDSKYTARKRKTRF